MIHIEDNDGDLALTKEALSELNYVINLETFKDGEQGLKYLEEKVAINRKQFPNLILLDINLPRLSGFEVLEAIKSNNLLKQIPVIIFSTSSFQKDIMKAYQLQANCFVTKPIEVLNFFDSVKNIMTFWMNTAVIPNVNRNYD